MPPLIEIEPKAGQPVKEPVGSDSKQHEPVAHVRFNFAMGLVHGILFRAGMAFSEPMSVLPVFLKHFTGSQAMIGVFSALMNAGGVLPQLLVAHRLEDRPRKKSVLVVAIWVRAALWLLLGLLAYFCPPDNATIVLVGLLLLLFGFSLAGGVANIHLGQGSPGHAARSLLRPSPTMGWPHGSSGGLCGQARTG